MMSRSLLVHMERASTFQAETWAKTLGQEGTSGSGNGVQK